MISPLFIIITFYGEVYSYNGYAVKVMPVNGTTVINDTQQMSLKDVLPEIAITRLLSDLSEDLPYYTHASKINKN